MVDSAERETRDRNELMEELRRARARVRELEQQLSRRATAPLDEDSVHLRGARSMPEGVLEVTGDGTVEHCNPRFADMVGCRPDAVAGSLFDRFLAPSAVEAVRKCLCGGQRSCEHQGQLVRSDGTCTPVFLSVQANGNGRHSAARIRLTDPDSVHAMKALLERIFDTTHMLLAYLDTDFRFVRVNQAYADAGGHPPQFFVGKNHFALYPNEGNERIFREVLDTGEPCFIHQKPFVYYDQPERGVTYWDWSLHPVPGTDGQTEGLLLSLLEVTERTRAEQELARQKELLQTIVDNVPVMITLYHPDGGIEFINRECERVLGWSREELQDIRIMEKVYPDPDYRREVWEHMQQANREWKDITMCTRQGTRLDSSWANVRLSDGSQIGIGIDITQRKRTEERIKRYQRELRHLAAQLAHAEERERRRLAVILHDQIGQPLTMAKLHLSMLCSRFDEMPDAGANAEKAQEMVQQAIESSRMLMFDLSPPILHEMGLHAALAKLAASMSESHGVTVDFCAAATGANADRRVEMVMFRSTKELVMNAITHADPRKVEIELDMANGRCRVCVRDDGSGFDVSQTGFHRHRDGGFGLFNIRERLDQLGGAMELESHPGHGTKVVLTAPLKEEKERGETEQA